MESVVRPAPSRPTAAMPAPFDPAILDSLAKYDTPTICNDIELFDVSPATPGT